MFASAMVPTSTNAPALAPTGPVLDNYPLGSALLGVEPVPEHEWELPQKNSQRKKPAPESATDLQAEHELVAGQVVTSRG